MDLRPVALVLVVLLGGCGRGASAVPPSPDPVRELVAKLADVSEEGLGYSSAYSGVDFLPYADAAHAGVLLLQQAPPVPSTALRSIVEAGVAAVAPLVECLADARPTRIPPVRALMWTSFADEMDFNERTEAAPPSTVNHDDAVAQPAPYQVTVGDLCFVALGQVLNRRWNAVRYQPSGGLVISSPSRSAPLRQAVEGALRGLTAARHREQLVRDFREPDHESRREGAALRLAYYYPEALEQPAVELLARPTFDVFAVDRFVRETLYRESDRARRRELFERFVREQGPAGRAGLLEQLFRDLETLEADEEHRLSPPLTAFRTQPRESLVDFYGLPADVRAKSRRWPEYLSTTELTRTVKVLAHARSARIDAAVRVLMLSTADGDLRGACAQRFLPQAR
jgi:hypothetical protein